MSHSNFHRELSPTISSSPHISLNQVREGFHNSANRVELNKVQPSAKEVAEEISKQFKNCLPHTHGESQLHRAAFEGDSFCLKRLLVLINADPSKFQAINQRNRLGCTPIRLAATSGHLECLTLLIEAGASIDIPDVKCQTPLFVAVKNRRFECAEKLLQAGASPEGDTGNSSTPLYVAFMNQDARYVLLLLDHGANPDQLRHSNPVIPSLYNPKFNSINAATNYLIGAQDITQVVKALLIRGCKTENFTYHTCVQQDLEEIVELLFNFGLCSDSRDLNNRLATELNLRNGAEAKLIQLRGSPRSLLSACRITIISSLSRQRRSLDSLDSLLLPSAIVSYLKYNDTCLH
ncbi:unnamed protein product [Lymnaea stagnalis]|uniref:SOCS box domain-containing protein n=1 Tax=Lymnaea stagnalis TaxID=6523 RepID=A0AAV2HGD0_LYMST